MEGILLFGPPASGKGTQGEMLAKSIGLYHFSTGDMFRELKDKKDLNELEQEILKTMTIDDGNFVSDEQTMKLFQQKMKEISQSRILLDGMPRTLYQVDKLNEIVEVKALLYIDVPEEELVRRSLNRGRVDDTEAIIKKRLQTYKDKTFPILEKYSSVAIKINGYQTEENVQKEIIDKLKQHKII
jgi:adenylate kinase